MLTIVAGNINSGPPTYGGLATATSLNSPGGVAVTPAGRLYIADTFNYTVDVVVPPAPASTAPPTISGLPTSGQTLTATTGAWTESPVIYTYQWQQCDSSGASCTAISAATASTYTLTPSDVGHTVRLIVTAQNGGGSAPQTSTASTLIAAAATTTTATTPSPTPTTTTTTTGPTTTTTPSAPVGLDQTTAGKKIRGQSAILGATVAPHSAAVSYRFLYAARRRSTTSSHPSEHSRPRQARKRSTPRSSTSSQAASTTTASWSPTTRGRAATGPIRP
jgi:hypothetical protein